MDIVLGFDIDLGGIQSVPLSDQKLSLNEVDTGNHFGNGMFHLNTGVHFDKVMIPFFIHEEFNGTGIDITDFFGDFHSVFVNGCQNIFIDGESGSIFHHFLITALYRAVSFKKMDNIAVFIR